MKDFRRPLENCETRVAQLKYPEVITLSTYESGNWVGTTGSEIENLDSVFVFEMCLQTKLTLRLDDWLVGKAMRTFKKTGKSVSKSVADYLEKLDASSLDEMEGITPKIANLKGMLKGTGVHEEEYHRYQEEKHL